MDRNTSEFFRIAKHCITSEHFISAHISQWLKRIYEFFPHLQLLPWNIRTYAL
jgi:hypothetical protein